MMPSIGRPIAKKRKEGKEDGEEMPKVFLHS